MILITKKERSKPKFSTYISDVCDLMASVQRDYQWSNDEVVRMDRLTQDYLHKLELDNLGYAERAKIATKLMQCRQERREHKDTIEILEPMVQFLETDKGRQMMNLLREALGKTRKAEERMQNRVYRPRVLEDDRSEQK